MVSKIPRDRGVTTICGRPSICTRLLIGLNMRTDHKMSFNFRSLFCKAKSIKSYGTQIQATSMSTRSLIGLNIMMGLQPRPTSNRGRSISRPRLIRGSKLITMARGMSPVGGRVRDRGRGLLEVTRGCSRKGRIGRSQNALFLASLFSS